jgi:hypothetical protein
MDDLPIVAAGREVPAALDRIRRYCGLPWSGGDNETWAWRYFDAVPTPEDALDATDVLCAAALHPGLSRADLNFFHDRRRDVEAWLMEIPASVRLWEVDDDTVERIAVLPATFSDVAPALLSKVLHRKRPHLIPPLDRHVIDWYRPVTGRRAAVEAWAPIVSTMRDEELDDQRRLTLAILESTLAAELWPERSPDERPSVSWLRMTDIAIWMGDR